MNSRKDTTLDSTQLSWTDHLVQVAVVGDVMLDEYLEGHVERISPEAPVPIHVVQKRDHRAGGAANVAQNISALGATAQLFSTYGNDEAGVLLRETLAKFKVSSEYLYEHPKRPTTRKTRVAANRQQMLRIDWEDCSDLDQTARDQIFSRIAALTQSTRALVISDYGKGLFDDNFLAKLSKLATEKKWITVADPKGTDFSKYRGFNILTPNHAEACLALGRTKHENDDPAELAKELQRRFLLQNILLTLGPRGMHFQPADPTRIATDESMHSSQLPKEAFSLAAKAIDVFDVSGAGDTVVATLALSLASGDTVLRAAHLANTAAGKVVERWGTYALSAAELKDALKKSSNSNDRENFGTFLTPHKIMTATEFMEEHRSGISKLAFTNGCFDILHAGHTRYLAAARGFGTKLIVGLNSDASVRRLKGSSRPVQNFAARAEVLSGLAAVDYIVEFDEDTPQGLIETVRPDVLVKGADYDEKDIVGADFVKSLGGTVERVQLVAGQSTTDIIKRSKS